MEENWRKSKKREESLCMMPHVRMVSTALEILIHLSNKYKYDPEVLGEFLKKYIIF